jgi:hypothetical protein
MPECPKCGLNATLSSNGFCPVCGARFTDGTAAASIEANPGGIPWENATDIGIFKAAFDTAHECLLSPGVFFTKLKPPFNALNGFLYALVLGSAGSVIGFFWTYLFSAWLSPYFPFINEFSGGAADSGAGLIIMPFLVAAQIAFAAIYMHTVLFLTKSKKHGFKSTFNIVCYAESAAILNVIPFIGYAVSIIWSLIIITEGISRVHRISRTRTILAVFLPLLILGFFCILVFIVIAGAAAALSGYI